MDGNLPGKSLWSEYFITIVHSAVIGPVDTNSTNIGKIPVKTLFTETIKKPQEEIN